MKDKSRISQQELFILKSCFEGILPTSPETHVYCKFTKYMVVKISLGLDLHY